MDKCNVMVNHIRDIYSNMLQLCIYIVLCYVIAQWFPTGGVHYQWLASRLTFNFEM